MLKCFQLLVTQVFLPALSFIHSFMWFGGFHFNLILYRKVSNLCPDHAAESNI